MSFPVVSVCDLFSKEKSEKNIVVHDLKELLTEDIFIPKKPHRHTFYQVLYIEKGSGNHIVDFKETSIITPVIYFLTPGQVHDLVFESKETSGLMINFNEDFFNSFLTRHNYLEEFPFFNRNGKNFFFVVENHQEKIKLIFQKIHENFISKTTRSIDLIRIYLLELFYIISEDIIPENEVILNTQNTLVKNFEKTLDKFYAKHHYPKFYADQLSVTPNYLNSVCKTITGKTAGEIIRNRIILEAKRLMVNSKLSISQIAYELNFEDNSYFTKFFKSQTLISPSDFRNAINK